MGSKKISRSRIVQNGAMSGTATLTSPSLNIENEDNVGLQIEWTGSPTGVISIMASVSAAFPEISSPNYFALTFDPALGQPSGSAGGYLINLNEIPFPWIRIRYVNASGTGTMQAFVFSKDVN